MRLLRCCQHYAWLVLLVGRRLRRLMVGLSCCCMCWAVAAVWGRFRLFQLGWAGTACSGSASPPSRWGVLWRCWAFLLVGRVLGGRKILKTGTTCPVPPWSQRYMDNPSSCTSRCPSAFLSVALVPIVCTPPSVAKTLRFAILFIASPCSLWEPWGALPAWWCGVRARVCWPVALAQSTGRQARCVPCCAVLRGSGGVCVGASVRLPEVRVVWLGGTPAFSVALRFSGPPAVVAAASVL